MFEDEARDIIMNRIEQNPDVEYSQEAIESAILRLMGVGVTIEMTNDQAYQAKVVEG